MEHIPRGYVVCKLQSFSAAAPSGAPEFPQRIDGSSRYSRIGRLRLVRAAPIGSSLAVAFSVKTKALQIAARKLGGPRKLRDYLRMPTADVVSWLAGIQEPPTPVFLRALELILDDLDNRAHQLRKER
jgi:hypothetical protein